MPYADLPVTTPEDAEYVTNWIRKHLPEGTTVERALFVRIRYADNGSAFAGTTARDEECSSQIRAAVILTFITAVVAFWCFSNYAIRKR
jgi:hypothetical protein